MGGRRDSAAVLCMDVLSKSESMGCRKIICIIEYRDAAMWTRYKGVNDVGEEV